MKQATIHHRMYQVSGPYSCRQEEVHPRSGLRLDIVRPDGSRIESLCWDDLVELGEMLKQGDLKRCDNCGAIGFPDESVHLVALLDRWMCNDCGGREMAGCHDVREFDRKFNHCF